MFPPCCAILLASAPMLAGRKSSERTTICRFEFLISPFGCSEKSIARSKPSLVVASIRSVSMTDAWAGSKEISVVRIKRPRITTCSISKIVIENGSSVAKSACVTPGASTPEISIRPVCSVLIWLTCLD